MNNVRTFRNYTKRNIDSNIYFRPDNKLAYKFVLLDLDNNPSKVILKSIQQFGAFLIIQTSKGHYQAWVYCPQIRTQNQYQMFAKYLAVRFNGDIGAAHNKQIGRLPGYLNRKIGRNSYKANVIYEADSKIDTEFNKVSLDKIYYIKLMTL